MNRITLCLVVLTLRDMRGSVHHSSLFSTVGAGVMTEDTEDEPPSLETTPLIVLPQ